jgi:hypothetical protein
VINSDFRRWLTDMVFSMTYANIGRGGANHPFAGGLKRRGTMKLTETQDDDVYFKDVIGFPRHYTRPAEKCFFKLSPHGHATPIWSIMIGKHMRASGRGSSRLGRTACRIFLCLFFSRE